MQINFFLASMTSGAYELHPNPMIAVLIRRWSFHTPSKPRRLGPCLTFFYDTHVCLTCILFGEASMLFLVEKEVFLAATPLFTIDHRSKPTPKLY
jgi:hypothetical protein